MRVPNKAYISTFPEKLYIKYLNNPDKLKVLANDYLNKYNTNVRIDGRNLLIKESLDHYVLERIMKDTSYINTEECKNYLSYINRINNINKSEYQVNVVFRNTNIRPYLLKTAKNKELLNSLFASSDKRDNVFLYYIEKMKTETISQENLDKVAEVLAKSKRFDSAYYETFMKYIMSPRVGDAIISPQVLDAITNYAPYYYGNYRPHLKYLEDTRCVLSDDFSLDLSGGEETKMYNKPTKGPGASYGDLKAVYVNRKQLLGRKLTDISDSKTERLSRGSDISFIHVFIYHELTHQIQAKNAMQEKYDDKGLSYAIKQLLLDEYKDYSYNHDSDEIELDADEFGWNMSALLYGRFYTRTDLDVLLANVRRNRKTADARRIFALKKDKDGNLIDKMSYDIEKVSEIIAKDPSKMDKFPMVKNFFHPNGHLKVSSLYDQSIGSEPMGQAMIKYMLKHNYVTHLLGGIKSGTIRLSEPQLDMLNHNLYMFYQGCLDQIESLDNAITKQALGEYKNIPDYSDSFFINKNIEHYRLLQQEYIKQVKPLFDYTASLHPKKEGHMSQYKKSIKTKGEKMQKIIAYRRSQMMVDQSKKTH